MSQCWQICLGLFLLKCLSFSDWLSSPLLSSQLTEAELHLVSLAVHMRGVTNYNTHQVGEMMADMASLLQTKAGVNGLLLNCPFICICGSPNSGCQNAKWY